VQIQNVAEIEEIVDHAFIVRIDRDPIPLCHMAFFAGVE
jgi:hypothetical protein